MIKRGVDLLFRKRDFGMLMGTQFLAQAGDGIVQAALAKFIAFGGQKGFDLDAANPQELLTIALYIFVPYTIISPFLGVVIDRWERRRLMFVANAFRAVVILIIGLVGYEAIPEGSLFLAFILTLSSTRVVLATKAAALPSTVDEDSLVEANAVSQLGGALFSLGGSGLAVVAASSISVDPIIIGGALVYGLAALFALWIRHAGEARPKSTFGKELAAVLGNIVAGFREVARHPAAAASIATYFWLRVLWSFALVGVGLLARELFGDKDLTIALVIGGAGAVGAVMGFVLAGAAQRRFVSIARVVVISAAIGGAGVAAFGVFESKLALPALTFFLGFGFFLAKVSLDTMVQRALGDDFRGRAFSLYDISYNVAWVVAAVVMKLFWSDDSGGLLISAMGVVFLIGVAGIAAWYRSAGLMSVTTEPVTAA